MAQHHLASSPETTHWGWFDAALPPVLTIDSGDRLVVDTVSGGPANLPPAGFHVPPELPAIHASASPQLGAHLMTGPVAVRGAMPGDVIELRILDVALRQDWGFTLIRPLGGALPGEFPEPAQIHPAIDIDRGTARLPWGTELTLAPFFGVMGLAPPPNWGPIASNPPRAHGGNLDNRELGPGATLYLPVWAEGGLFSCGDGHGIQGDGEVCLTAIETALTGTFELHLHKGRGWDYPRAETPTHLISMGMHEDLDTAARDALRRMIDWLADISTLTRTEAYMQLSLTGDLRVTQVVNGEKGCHMMIAKSIVRDLPGVTGFD